MLLLSNDNTVFYVKCRLHNAVIYVTVTCRFHNAVVAGKCLVAVKCHLHNVVVASNIALTQ